MTKRININLQKIDVIPNKVLANTLDILWKEEVKYDSVRDELILLGGHRNEIIDNLVYNWKVIGNINIHSYEK